MDKINGKDIKDLEVYLPLTDGTELKCTVEKAFDVKGKAYVALAPCEGEKTLMLYRVDVTEEGEPVVNYIEDDAEFEDVYYTFLGLEESKQSS